MRIINKKIALIGLFIISACMFTVAHATAEGFYFGVQVGAANLNNEDQLINTGITTPFGAEPPCSTSDTTNCNLQIVQPSNTGVAERIFIGSNINQYAGFEVGFGNYTPSEYTPDVAGTHEPHVWEFSLDLMAKLMYPIGRFGVFGKAGIAFVYQSTSPAIITSPNNEDNSGGETFVTPAFGAGISFDITPNWVVDISANRIQNNDSLKNIDFYALGISYHIVKEYCGQFLC